MNDLNQMKFKTNSFMNIILNSNQSIIKISYNKIDLKTNHCFTKLPPKLNEHKQNVNDKLNEYVNRLDRDLKKNNEQIVFRHTSSIVSEKKTRIQ
jgi:hypothetical protein